MGDRGLSRFSRKEVPSVLGFFDRAGPSCCLAISGSRGVAFRALPRRRHPELV